tara:strand:+ start:127 stop:882 length:756 start_codon:yes stop_codon:yes gene_type:complete
MPGSEVVPQAAGMATLPMSNPPKTFLLPFGKNQHLVPESAFVSFPKKANRMPSAEALGALLATKAPEKWLPYCKPNTLCRIQGDTGNCVYTTFQVDGHPGEERILRNISSAIAEKNFKEIKKTEKPPPEGANDRQQIRYNVLNWTKETDCPSRAQISPEIEKWPIADVTEALKSCAISPEAKKRTKPGTSQADEQAATRRRYICSEELIKVPPNTTYKINEVGSHLLHVLFYRAEGPGDNGAPEEEDGEDQ